MNTRIAPRTTIISTVPPRRQRGALAVILVALLAAATGACTVVRDSAGDTVRVVDSVPQTFTHVDTVVVVDTVVDTVYLRDSTVALGLVGDSVLGAPGRSAGARNASALGKGPPPAASLDPLVTAADLAVLRAKQLAVPVAGVRVDQLLDTYSERRGTGGARLHGALDIPAPRGTPVLSADDGRVLQVDTSQGGGLSVYVGDPTERFIYYYAHLNAFRPGLATGQQVRKGDVVGYVGTTGNAPPNVPHLHFAIARSDDPRRWWAGTPLDPLPIYRGPDH